MFSFVKHDKKISILVVDDDADFREIISTKLNAAGFDVKEAVDGEDGLEKTKKTKPDLVLLDVRMPKLNGIETLSRIKADADLSNIKVLFLTNLGEADKELAWLDNKFAQDIGAIGHIKKSDDLDSIIARIKNLPFNGQETAP